jgi:murein DD-endopeptidase MepM/ murein hydrolase activator NlpD
MNVPGAIGAARDSSGTVTSQQLQQSRTIAAGQLRTTLVRQEEERASRTRAARASAVQQVQQATEAAREAREAARPDWVLPVEHFRLTAGFGDYGLWAHSHTGQDFACPIGTAIHAIGDGKIIFAGYDGAYGNKLVIQHPDGTVSWYAHMEAFVRTSGQVRAGDVIGKVGMTGNTTGPHVHLEIRPGGGAPVEPLAWLRNHGIKI